ncbi:MAG: hypothetical protein GXP42_14965 [Chloroflexi bacterium]|nr:hypothetical protein [Chloroflexota bacterium]
MTTVSKTIEIEDEIRLKNLFKEAFSEVLIERQDVLAEIVMEAIEDFALIRAIQEGEDSEEVSEEEVLRALRGE